MASVAASPGDDSHINDESLETFHLVWLDDNSNNDEQRRNIQKQLRTTINHLKIFDKVHKCREYIEQMSKHDRIILIVSDRLGLEVVPFVHQLRQVSSIYIYCMDTFEDDQWTKKYKKVKAVVIQPNELISQIILDHKIQKKVDEPLGIDVITKRGIDGKSTTALNGQFLHSQQLMDVLFRMKSRPTDKEEFCTLCTKEYADNPTELALIEKYQKFYLPSNALWWYTCESFLYKILNKALREQTINVLFLLRSFIRDIYRELKHYQCQSSVRVYRGQSMSTDEVNTLKYSMGELLSINPFLSTSVNREIAYGYLYSCTSLKDMQRVLFEIDADPLVLGKDSMIPFADISLQSDFDSESEVLFMLGSIFRLNDIQCDDNGVFIIRMTLCGDDENDLKQLLEHMKKRTTTNLRSLSDVLKDMGKFDMAEKYFHRCLNELPSNDSSRGFLYHSLSVVAEKKGDNDKAARWLEQAIEIFKQSKSPNNLKSGQLRNLIGELHRLKGEYNEALKSYNEAFSIFQSAKAVDPIKMAMIYSNLSFIYQAQEKYSEALVFEEKSLSLQQDHLPDDHCDLGETYTNIGIVHSCLGHHELALEMLQKSLKIKDRSLPPHHPEIGTSYQHKGLIYENKNELEQALINLQKALTIYSHELSWNHPNIVKCKQDIQRLQGKLENMVSC